MSDPTKWENAYEKPITYMLTNNELTEKIIPYSQHFREIVTQAFHYWENNSQLRFLEVNEEDIAEIKISFEEPGTFHGNCKSKFPEVQGDDHEITYAHATYPPYKKERSDELMDQYGNPGAEVVRYRDTIHGDLHFNSAVLWSTDVLNVKKEDDRAFMNYNTKSGVITSENATSLQSAEEQEAERERLREEGRFRNLDVAINIYGVAIHEIGHTLGLGHVEDPESLMYSTI